MTEGAYIGSYFSGADIRFQTVDSETDFTGRTTAIINASAELSGRITATITDAENGTFTAHIEGTNPIPPNTYQFSIQLNGDGLDSIVYRYKVQIV